MKKTKGGFRLRRALFPAGYYAANSVYQGYISLYYANLGFSGGQMGLISAATAAAALVFQPLWGMLGDRVRSRRLLLAALSLAAAIVFPLKLAGTGFLWQLFTAAAFYAFFCALLPLGDSLLVSCGDAFGPYRLAGGISFAIAGAAYGLLRPKLGEHALWAVSLLLAFAAAAALCLPQSSGGEKRGGMLRLLKDRRLVLLLALMLPLQMSMGYFYTFYAPRFKALGGSDALLGLGYLVSAASEAPYLIFSGRIYRRFGAGWPMCVAAGLLALRWLALGLVPSAGAALLSQLLHGGGFIVITVSMAYWIGDHAPRDLQASGQSLLNMVSFGLARIIGNLGGGWIAQRWGMEGGFLLGAALCASAGLGLAVFAGKRK